MNHVTQDKTWFRAWRKCARHCQPRVLAGSCTDAHLRACRRWRLQSDIRAPQQRDRVRRHMCRRFVRARALETWCPRLPESSRYAMARTYPRLRPYRRSRLVPQAGFRVWCRCLGRLQSRLVSGRAATIRANSLGPGRGRNLYCDRGEFAVNMSLRCPRPDSPAPAYPR